MGATLATLVWVDWALVAVVLLSLLLGVWRGLTYEVLALLGWVAAFVAAHAWAPSLAVHLPVGAPGSGLQHAAGFAAVFTVVLVAWTLAAQLVRLLVRATPLNALDRTLGAGFGLLRALLVLLVLTTVVLLTPASQAPVWRASQGAQWLTELLRDLSPMLPASWVLAQRA
jgi:membrane protein required for colicin V production